MDKQLVRQTLNRILAAHNVDMISQGWYKNSNKSLNKSFDDSIKVKYYSDEIFNNGIKPKSDNVKRSYKVKELYNIADFKVNDEIRYITVCGIYDRVSTPDTNYITLRIGMAISNPIDTYKEDVGKRIAKHRAENTPIATFRHFAKNVLLTTKVINDMLQTVANRVVNNPDKFIAALRNKADWEEHSDK